MFSFLHLVYYFFPYHFSQWSLILEVTFVGWILILTVTEAQDSLTSSVSKTLNSHYAPQNLLNQQEMYYIVHVGSFWGFCWFKLASIVNLCPVLPLIADKVLTYLIPLSSLSPPFFIFSVCISSFPSLDSCSLITFLNNWV